MNNLIRWVNSSSKLAELVRFGMVGGFCTVLQYGIYVVFAVAIGLPATVSTMISYAISFIANFFLSSLFTFKKKANPKRGLAFAMSHLINMGLQTGFVAIFNLILPKELALLPALGICIPINYIMVRFSFTSRLLGGKSEYQQNTEQNKEADLCVNQSSN